MVDTLPSSLYNLMYLIIPMNVLFLYNYCINFIDEETENQENY